MGHIKHLLVIISLIFNIITFPNALSFPRLKYSGGGDWYNGPTEIPNLLRRFKQEFNIEVSAVDLHVEANTRDFFEYPMLFTTGHGRVIFSELERENLRRYCENGGFWYIDDDYGLDEYIRPELKRIFPDRELIPLPANHKIFHIWYKFENGIPQIHKHYEEPPVAYGIFDDNGNLMVLYTYNCNISDGWDSPGVHPETTDEVREIALKMGVNILLYALLY